MYELQWITRKPDAEKQLFVVVGKPLRALAAGNKLASRAVACDDDRGIRTAR